MSDLTAVLTIVLVFGSFMGAIFYFGKKSKGRTIDLSHLTTSRQDSYDEMINRQIQKDIRDNTKR